MQMMENGEAQANSLSICSPLPCATPPSIFSSTPDSFFSQSHHELAQRGSCLLGCPQLNPSEPPWRSLGPAAYSPKLHHITGTGAADWLAFGFCHKDQSSGPLGNHRSLIRPKSPKAAKKLPAFVWHLTRFRRDRRRPYEGTKGRKMEPKGP